MKDIDFDELDRAVSSLMETVPKKESTTEEMSQELNVTPEPAVVSLPEEPASIPQPETEPVQESEEEPGSALAVEVDTEEPEVQPIAVPAMRRGRFMDVMHPSARGATRPALTTPTRREAPMLQPAAPSISEEIAVDSVSTDQSDPLANFQSEEVETRSQDAAVTAVESFSTEEGPINAEQEQMQESFADFSSDPAPLNSPFLPDAKVEKRPLGRPESLQSVPDLASEPASGADKASEESLPTDQPAISPNKDAQLPEQPLPAELSSDILSVETDSGHMSSEPAHEAPSILTPKVETPAPKVKVASAVIAVSAEAPRSMAVTSIPQQYKSQPSSTNSEVPAGAIYDTQPLAHPAKKKPAWIWVVAFVGIVLLGIGGGVAIYYLSLN